MFVQIQWRGNALDKLAEKNSNVAEFLAEYRGEGDVEKIEDFMKWDVDVIETELAVVAIEAMRQTESVGVMTFVDGVGYKMMSWA